jgi:hypothetical protein
MIDLSIQPESIHYPDCGLRIADCGLRISSFAGLGIQASETLIEEGIPSCFSARQRQRQEHALQCIIIACPTALHNTPCPDRVNPQSAIRNPQSVNPQSAIRNPQSVNPQSAILNPQLADVQGHFAARCSPSGDPR